MNETERFAEILQNLIDTFHEGELRTLCFDLGVDYDTLPGHNKADKARELLALLNRTGRMRELVTKLSKLRPNIPWREILATAEAEFPGEGGRLAVNPSNVEIRQFILDTFSEDDFIELFCTDYFPQAKNDFAADMPFTRKAQRLIEYCQHRDVVDNLLADLQKERPVAYARRLGSVAPQPEEVVQASQPPVHNPDQIFISHAHEDAEFAHRLAMNLRQRGWLVWITPDSIHPGEKWVAAIGRGLDESGVFLTLLTPAAVASGWVKSETDSAIDLEHEHQIRLIPLLVQQCPVPTLLRSYQRISFINDYTKGLAQLINALEPSHPVLGRASTLLEPEQQSGQYTTKALLPDVLAQIRKIPARGWMIASLALIALLVVSAVVPQLFPANTDNALPTKSAVTTVPTALPVATDLPAAATTVAPMLSTATPAGITPVPSSTTPEEPGLTVTNDGGFANVRAGPDVRYELLGQLQNGAIAAVRGKNADGTWWQITFASAPSGLGWVRGDLVRVNTAANNVPVVQAPPLTPRPIASATSEPLTTAASNAPPAPTNVAAATAVPSGPVCDANSPDWRGSNPNYPFCARQDLTWGDPQGEFNVYDNGRDIPLYISWNLYGSNINQVTIHFDHDSKICGFDRTAQKTVNQVVPAAGKFDFNVSQFPSGGTFKVYLMVNLTDGRTVQYGEKKLCIR